MLATGDRVSRLVDRGDDDPVPPAVPLTTAAPQRAVTAGARAGGRPGGHRGRPLSADPSPQETLAWERERRPWAAVAAIAAGVLTVGGNIVVSLGLRGLPKAEDEVVTVVDALGDAVAGRPVPPGRLSAQVEYLGHHTAAPIAGDGPRRAGDAGAVPAAGVPLPGHAGAQPGARPVGARPAGDRHRALRRRQPHGEPDALPGRPRLPDAVDRSNSAAQDALTQPPYAAGTALTFAGSFALLFGLAVTSLNAMRVGLLTRFMGILGMIVAATFLLPLDQLGIIRSLWLGALAALLLGRWPSGVPPAWSTGEAVPWPTQQDAREARARARAEEGDGDATPAAADAPRAAHAAADGASSGRAPAPPAPGRPAPRAATAQPSSKKKRRKRRS